MTGAVRQNDDPLEALRGVGAFYECPKDEAGKRLGPLVGYAGRDLTGRQFVGDVYVNFAQAERHPRLLAGFARRLLTVLRERGLGPLLDTAAGFCGAPEGGKAFAYGLAAEAGKQYIYPEKRVTALADATRRETTDLVFSRHEPASGESWFIVEDVCNNFSTTSTLVDLIESHGARVPAVLCFLNRSGVVDADYSPRPDLVLPVVAVVRKPFRQYEQSDDAVASDIAGGNVVWSPKRDWGRLAAAGGR